MLKKRKKTEGPWKEQIGGKVMLGEMKNTHREPPTTHDSQPSGRGRVVAMVTLPQWFWRVREGHTRGGGSMA